MMKGSMDHPHQRPHRVTEHTAGTAATVMHRGQDAHAGHGDQNAAMVADFRRRLWVSLALTPPVLFLSPLIRQGLELGDVLRFPGDGLVLMALSSVVYVYGGGPVLSRLFCGRNGLQPRLSTPGSVPDSAAPCSCQSACVY